MNLCTLCALTLPAAPDARTGAEKIGEAARHTGNSIEDAARKTGNAIRDAVR